MKNLLKFVASFAFILLISNCTSDAISTSVDNESSELNTLPPCIDDDPITRIVNNGTIDFGLEVFDNNGDVVALFANVPANSTTSWASFATGEMLFSITNNQPGKNDEKVILQMDTCTAFDIEIDANNDIVSYLPIML